MADLTIPLVALTGLFGYYLSDNSKKRVESMSNKIQENELPTGKTIYTSNQVYDAESQVYDALKKNYIDSMDPDNTNVIPPIYNTYATRATENLDVLGVNSNKKVSEFNEFQRLANINKNNKKKPEANITSAPMFKSFLKHQGDSRTEKVYTEVENLGGREVSLLTGEVIDKRHNNMVPFFGGTVKQNTEKFTNKTRLDLYTGEEDTYIEKREIKPMQDKLPENIHGSPVFTTQIDKDRFVPSYYRNNEAPVERQYISAPIAGTGENNIRSVYRNVDELRTKNNAKKVYKGRQNAGQIASVRGTTVPVEKNRPERVFDWGEDRWNKTTGEYIAHKKDDNFENMQYTNRTDTNMEYYGGATNDVNESYIPYSSSEEKPSDSIEGFENTNNKVRLTTLQQYAKRSQHIPGDNAFRNINGRDSANDYGKSGYNGSTVPETQRATTYTTHILNTNKEGSVPTSHFQDQAKTTIKDSTSHMPYAIQGQVSSDFNGGRTSAIEAGSASYQVRSTQKESMVKNKYSQGIRYNDYGMGYITTNVTADTTNKEVTTNDPRSDYRGIANNAEHNAYESRLSTNNAQINTKQEQLISNERISGPQKFQINAGKHAAPDMIHKDNKLFSEQENTVKMNIESRVAAPTKDLLGEFDPLTAVKAQTVEQGYQRMDTKIYNQLDKNPFVNNNMRAYKETIPDFEGKKNLIRKKVMNTWDKK